MLPMQAENPAWEDRRVPPKQEMVVHRMRQMSTTNNTDEAVASYGHRVSATSIVDDIAIAACDHPWWMTRCPAKDAEREAYETACENCPTTERLTLHMGSGTGNVLGLVGALRSDGLPRPQIGRARRPFGFR